jgi:multidrug efflux pump subunit AcrA (membrane-fusion protein)
MSQLRATHVELRRGWIPVTLIVSLGVCALGMGGGLWWWYQRAYAEVAPDMLTMVVEPVTFELDITDRGELESASNTEVRCLVKAGKQGGGIAILKIVPEGTIVNQGDFLVQLDSSQMELDRTQQQISVNTSEAIMIQSRNTYETALIAKREYIEGTFVAEKQTIEGEIFLKEENLSRAREYLKYSQRLADKGYITPLQLEADAFAVEKARNELATAKTRLRALEEFTQAKMIKQLESDIATSKARWEADKNSHKLELDKLADLDREIAACTIVAPDYGQVKYAHRPDGRGDSGIVIEEGVLVRERQVIIRLPDVNNMQVKLELNESVVARVREEMQATVRIVGIKDLVLPGSVTKVNEYSEPSSWRKANVKEYAAFVQVARADDRLRSGMSAEVTIHCQSLPNVISVPVQAVLAHGEDYYCFVRDAEGAWDPREVQLGPTNDLFVVVDHGLAKGDVVATDPRSYPKLAESLPELAADELQQVVRKDRLPAEGRASDAAPSKTADGAAPDKPQFSSASVFDRMDKNGDGKVSKSELPSAAQDGFDEVDSNGDGGLDKAEFAAAMAKMRSGGQAGRPAAGVGAGQ